MTDSQPTATVVIPSRDRPDLLANCLGAVAGQRTTYRYTVVVVDDGSTPPLQHADPVAAAAAAAAAAGTEIRFVRGAGSGPARARNLGVRAASSSLVLFTDDDTEPDVEWVESACGWLDRHPEAVGVEGPTTTDPYDPLFQHTVDAPDGGCWTCNVAYRRSVLEELGGFCEDFPFAHAEDVDLAYRALDVGPIGFVREMHVRHPPRDASLMRLIREGRYMASQLAVANRHPRRYPDRVHGWRLFLILLDPARSGAAYARTRGLGLLRDRRAIGRLAAVVLGQSAVGAWTLARHRGRLPAHGASEKQIAR